MSTANTIKTNMKTNFENANDAYEYYHDRILQYGLPFGNTKAIFNVGFYLNNPSTYLGKKIKFCKLTQLINND